MKNESVEKGILVFIAKQKEILKWTFHQMLDGTSGNQQQRKN